MKRTRSISHATAEAAAGHKKAQRSNAKRMYGAARPPVRRCQQWSSQQQWRYAARQQRGRRGAARRYRYAVLQRYASTKNRASASETAGKPKREIVLQEGKREENYNINSSENARNIAV